MLNVVTRIEHSAMCSPDRSMSTEELGTWRWRPSGLTSLSCSSLKRLQDAPRVVAGLKRRAGRSSGPLS